MQSNSPLLASVVVLVAWTLVMMVWMAIARALKSCAPTEPAKRTMLRTAVSLIRMPHRLTLGGPPHDERPRGGHHDQCRSEGADDRRAGRRLVPRRDRRDRAAGDVDRGGADAVGRYDAGRADDQGGLHRARA